eukprot:TRINITY_DN47790_c0_g1_i1.p1 TRINITY_DN47790_c0_g1~~TRINITY_DN47790_c0_g1_i1.p1  ORF type:complete len:121 (+),score=27.73 TRINITY_DN47790_c0_g1_i1:88-450(+)
MLRSLVGSEMCIRDRSRVYQSLFKFLDERPPFGIFQYRWGDAPIHTLGVMTALQGDWSKICYYPRDQFDYRHALKHPPPISNWCTGPIQPCLLYTSDAADEEDSVDLGGRRIIKKKKKKL